MPAPLLLLVFGPPPMPPTADAVMAIALAAAAVAVVAVAVAVADVAIAVAVDVAVAVAAVGTVACEEGCFCMLHAMLPILLANCVARPAYIGEGRGVVSGGGVLGDACVKWELLLVQHARSPD